MAVEHLDWTVDYDAEAYIRLLSTFSGHIAMPPERREQLFSEIRRRLSLRPSGQVRRGWGAVLHVARRREEQLSGCGSVSVTLTRLVSSLPAGLDRAPAAHPPAFSRRWVAGQFTAL